MYETIGDTILSLQVGEWRPLRSRSAGIVVLVGNRRTIIVGLGRDTALIIVSILYAITITVVKRFQIIILLRVAVSCQGTGADLHIFPQSEVTYKRGERLPKRKNTP